MFAYLSSRTHPHPAPRLRRTIAALTAVTGALLAWATVPGRIRRDHHDPGPAGHTGRSLPLADAPAQVIAVGGMPGWQITLIAVAAALVAATATVLLDRVRASRRTAVTG